MPLWFYYALAAAVFAALTAIFAKIGVQQVDSDVATFVRTIVIAVSLVAFLTYTKKWSLFQSINGKSAVFLVLSGLATGLSWLAYFKALQLGQASQVAPIDKLSVVLVTLFAVIFLGERPSAQEWLGIGLILLGVLVLAFKR